MFVTYLRRNFYRSVFFILYSNFLITSKVDLKSEIQNNKLLILGKLTASIAHEIRNPLSAIKLEIESMRMCLSNNESEINDSLNSCMEATERINSIIQTTLEFSRKNTRITNNVDLNEICVKTNELLAAQAGKKKSVFSCKLEQHLPSIRINKNKVLQVTINLTTNAIEAIQEGGKVQLRTKITDSGTVILEIIDNGIGIKEEDKPKIFTDFYTNKKIGTGLGLGVCKMLIEEQGGKISFESKEGKGSKFTVIFPPEIVGIINEP